MRAFLALEVSGQVMERLQAAQEELKKTGADLGLVARENTHFTVKFLGEIPESAVSEIDTRIGRLKLRAIEIAVRGMGAFPDPRRPRVVWAGVGSEDELKMNAICKSVIGALEGIGRPEDHDFHAHITLARVRSPRNTEALTSLIRRNQALDFGRTKIDIVKLKSSRLTPRGPIYSDVREYGMN